MIFDTVLFDLDDTIHDRRKTLNAFIDLFILKYSFALDETNRIMAKETFLAIDNGGYTPRVEVFNELLNRVSWGKAPEYEELINFWNAEFPRCAVPMPDVYIVLDYLTEKGIKLGIVTNGNTDFQNIKIDKLDFRKYMKTMVISEEVHVRKPDPRIFNLALSAIGSAAETTLFVGDNPITDIKGAMDSNLTAAWLSRGENWNPSLSTPKYILNDITDLIRVEGVFV